MSRAATLAILALCLVLSGEVRAQSGSSPGTGLTPMDTICRQAETQIFCNLIKIALDTAAGSQLQALNSLNNRLSNATVFAPRDYGFTQAAPQMARFMGINSVPVLYSQPAVVARFVLNHLVLHEEIDARDMRNNQVVVNALNMQLHLLEGLKLGNFVAGPFNRAKLVTLNLEGGKALVHVLDRPVFPTPA